MSTSNAEGVGDGTGSGTGPRTDEVSVSTAMRYARRAAGSGTLAGVVGGAVLLRGLRAIRHGDRGRGLVRILLGAVFVATAAAQRRSAGGGGGAEGGERGGAGVEPTDVAGTAPDGEGTVGNGEDAENRAGRHEGGEAVDVTETSTDIDDVESVRDDDDASVGAAAGERQSSGGTASNVEDVGPGSAGEPERAASEGATTADIAGQAPETDTADDETAADVQEGTYERLGEAAFDEHSCEVPVPQRAFDQRVLSLGDEAFWGIRESDDAVVITGLFDSLQEQEGVRYVASSRIDEERMLHVPDVIVNHWNDVVDGGIAVAGGDDLLFALAEDAKADDQLFVVPEQWADDFPGLGGEGSGDRGRAE